MLPKKKAKLIAEVLVEKKAKDVILMNLRKVTDMSYYFVVCTGESQIHLRALAQEVESKVGRPWHIEGYSQAEWILLDYIDVVVHIFLESTREYYTIEELWADAPIEKIA